MGIFSGLPADNHDKLREHIKNMFPFVVTVIFIYDPASDCTNVELITKDGTGIRITFSNEIEPFIEKNFGWTLEKIRHQVHMLYTPKEPPAATWQWPDVDDQTEINYENLEQKLIEQMKVPPPLMAKDMVQGYNYLTQQQSADKANWLTQKLKEMNIDEIMAKYANTYLTQDQQEIVKQKTYDYMGDPTSWNYTPSTGVGVQLRTILPTLVERVKCPQCGTGGNVEGIIIHLNDNHKMSREYIADWLESTDLDLEFKTEGR